MHYYVNFFQMFRFVLFRPYKQCAQLEMQVYIFLALIVFIQIPSVISVLHSLDLCSVFWLK